MGRKRRKTSVVIDVEDVKSGKKHVIITDAETGEVIKEYWTEDTDNPGGRPAGGKKVHFMKLYKTNWLDIVMNKRLTPYETGIFSMLFAFLDWQSPYIVHPKTHKNLNESELAELLQVDRAQLNVTLQSLCDKGMIKKVYGGCGRPNHFVLNTNVIFHGNSIKDANDHMTFIKDCSYKPLWRSNIKLLKRSRK